MSFTLQESVILETDECYKCAVIFAMPQKLKQRLNVRSNNWLGTSLTSILILERWKNECMTILNTKRHLLVCYFSTEIFWIVRFTICVFTTLNTLEVSIGVLGVGRVYQFQDPTHRKGL